MANLLNFKNVHDLTGFSLIIPSVSVGNVGQLTADLVISTYNLEKIATVWHPGLICMAASDPYALENNEVCTACELYANTNLKLAVLQLRSSIEIKMAFDFFSKLKKELIELKFGNVIILTSTFAYEKHVVDSTHFRHVGCDTQIASALGIQSMECGDSLEGLTVAGSGFALRLYDLLENSIPTIILFKYASEGDNRPDAIAMLDLLCNFIDKLNNKDIFKLNFPVSWNFVFGNPPPIGLY